MAQRWENGTITQQTWKNSDLFDYCGNTGWKTSGVEVQTLGHTPDIAGIHKEWCLTRTATHGKTWRPFGTPLGTSVQKIRQTGHAPIVIVRKKVHPDFEKRRASAEDSNRKTTYSRTKLQENNGMIHICIRKGKTIEKETHWCTNVERAARIAILAKGHASEYAHILQIHEWRLSDTQTHAHTVRDGCARIKTLEMRPGVLPYAVQLVITLHVLWNVKCTWHCEIIIHTESFEI